MHKLNCNGRQQVSPYKQLAGLRDVLFDKLTFRQIENFLCIADFAFSHILRPLECVCVFVCVCVVCVCVVCVCACMCVCLLVCVCVCACK